MRSDASSVLAPGRESRGGRRGHRPRRPLLRLQRSAGNAAVTANLGILRQSFGFGPPIMYSPTVRKLVELQTPPQDLIKDDPMNPGSGLPTGELRDARLGKLRDARAAAARGGRAAAAGRRPALARHARGVSRGRARGAPDRALRQRRWEGVPADEGGGARGRAGHRPQADLQPRRRSEEDDEPHRPAPRDRGAAEGGGGSSASPSRAPAAPPPTARWAPSRSSTTES